LVFDADLSRPSVNDGVAVNQCVGSCDSNVILKARPDRECAEWLDCSTVITEIDDQGQENDICLDLIACTSAAENGVCERVKLYELDDDSMDLYTEPISPSNIDRIKNYSGFMKVGAYWSQTGKLAQGYYPFNLMTEIGESTYVPNGNFESTYSGSSRPLGWGVDHYGSEPTDNEWTNGKFQIGNESRFT